MSDPVTQALDPSLSLTHSLAPRTHASAIQSRRENRRLRDCGGRRGGDEGVAQRDRGVVDVGGDVGQHVWKESREECMRIFVEGERGRCKSGGETALDLVKEFEGRRMIGKYGTDELSGEVGDIVEPTGGSVFVRVGGPDDDKEGFFEEGFRGGIESVIFTPQ